MAITAKPTSYTVNTGHAKVPTHLWMLDENTGTTASDKGTGTAMDMTLQNAAQWGTDATLGTIVTCSSSLSYYAMTGTATIGAANNTLMVAICKSASNVAATAEFVVGSALSTNTTKPYGGIRWATDENAQAVYDDGTNVAANSGSFGSIGYNQTWRMVAMKVQDNAIAVSMDGGAWVGVTPTLNFPNASIGAPNRYAIGARPVSTPNLIFNGDVLAAWVYQDGTYADWTDAWISSLYTDPWQFLNTSTVAPKAYYEMMRRA